VATEVLSAHQAKLAALHLIPVTGGRFEVLVGDRTVYDKRASKRLPQDGEIEAAVAKALT
jgi:predicted Rdx family selenoprotein